MLPQLNVGPFYFSQPNPTQIDIFYTDPPLLNLRINTGTRELNNTLAARIRIANTNRNIIVQKHIVNE